MLLSNLLTPRAHATHPTWPVQLNRDDATLIRLLRHPHNVSRPQDGSEEARQVRCSFNSRLLGFDMNLCTGRKGGGPRVDRSVEEEGNGVFRSIMAALKDEATQPGDTISIAPGEPLCFLTAAGPLLSQGVQALLFKYFCSTCPSLLCSTVLSHYRHPGLAFVFSWLPQACIPSQCSSTLISLSSVTVMQPSAFSKFLACTPYQSTEEKSR